MITLKRVRLVNWHFFEDVLIPIGNLCLFAGDNGSGKSTIVDAIQYAMASDLRKTRFNAAAGERRGGRDLSGYVRCKLGSESTDYLRGDTVAHVILEFSTGSGDFTAGVCIEAFTDGRTNDRFYLAPLLPVDGIRVCSSDGKPLVWRQFQDSITAAGAVAYESATAFRRDFTGRLGVWRRMSAYNPYLEAFTRSVSFTPLVSVDKFVCDYILEEQSIDLTVMKSNLNSYKQAEAAARATKQRISSLQEVMATGSECINFQRIQIQQDWLKRRIDRDIARANFAAQKEKEEILRSRLDELTSILTQSKDRKSVLETDRRESEAALARDDAHLLYSRMRERLGELGVRLAEVSARSGRYQMLRAQCATLLESESDADLETEISRVEKLREESAQEAERIKYEIRTVSDDLRERLAELSDLEKGIRRFPESAIRLRDELNKAGIDAWILADLAEVSHSEWADAVEGWLNTLRFACIVDPASFQKALSIYDGLPRSVAGIPLPNIARMRDAEVREGSLAKMVVSENPWAKSYLDCVLGDVMTADIATLKNYSKAVTKDCMSYSRFTASRIKEEVYRDSWLGKAARERRKATLENEIAALREKRTALENACRLAAEKTEIFRRALKSLSEAGFLFPSMAEERRLTAERDELDAEIKTIDTSAFKDLEKRIAGIKDALAVIEENLDALNTERGARQTELGECLRAIDACEKRLALREAELLEFEREHEAMAAECESYIDERLRAQTPEIIEGSWESARKGIETRREKALREFRSMVQAYNNSFNALIPAELDEIPGIRELLGRLESSELPEYLEKIHRARADAEREFKEHFIARLNELIEEAHESFKEINETLRTMTFGRDQYRFTLEERADRRGQISIVKKTAEVTSFEDGLFSQLTDNADRDAANALFDGILNADLDSAELRSVCDYRTYFTYDIKVRDTQSLDPSTLKPNEYSLAKVLREKSGGEAQTPYYVAIAASFYRFCRDKPESTIRFVLFDEAFDRLDDERIGKVLNFYKQMGLQVVISVPTEKIESIAPYMDCVNLVIRHGYTATVRDYRVAEPKR